jgi:hypothetical protein
MRPTPRDSKIGVILLCAVLGAIVIIVWASSVADFLIAK